MQQNFVAFSSKGRNYPLEVFGRFKNFMSAKVVYQITQTNFLFRQSTRALNQHFREQKYMN